MRSRICNEQGQSCEYSLLARPVLHVGEKISALRSELVELRTRGAAALGEPFLRDSKVGSDLLPRQIWTRGNAPAGTGRLRYGWGDSQINSNRNPERMASTLWNYPNQNTGLMANALCYGLGMERKMPPLPPGVELVNVADPIHEVPDALGPWPLLKLKCSYRVDAFDVEIGWTFGLPMGDFREPDELSISFNADSLADMYSQETGSAEKTSLALGGLTTKILRKLPVAHAQALMRDRYESLVVDEVKRLMTPLPPRVEDDRDYVHIASAYVALASASMEPVRRLAEWTGTSVDTWFARLKRARARGILEGTGQKARITATFQEASNQLWRERRAREEADGGS